MKSVDQSTFKKLSDKLFELKAHVTMTFDSVT
jgi:hypothetical protein